MKRRFSLFTYPIMDIKAAEAMLNRRAAAGWRLERVWLGLLAAFVPAEAPVCYCIDWSDPVRGDGWSYGALLAQAGWRRHSRVTYRVIYEAPADTTPIQTDSELEYQRFRGKVLRRMLIGGGVVAACLLFLLIVGLAAGIEGPRWTDVAGVMAHTSFGAVLLLLLPLLTAGGLAWLLRMGLRLWQWRRCARAGEPFPVPGPVSAGVAASCCLLGWLWAFSLLFPLALDAVDGSVNRGWALGTFIGALIVLLRREEPELAHRRRYAAVMMAVAAAAIVLPHVTPDGLTAPFYPRSPMAEAQVLEGEDTWCVHFPEEASLLVSYSRWEEGDELDDSRFLSGTCWNTRSTALADRLLAEYRAEAGAASRPPLAGYAGVWYVPAAERPEDARYDTWLFRRGNAVLRVECNQGLLDESHLAAVWNQLGSGA